MSYALVFISIAVIWLFLFFIAGRKNIGVPHMITAILSAVFSLSFDSILGEHFGLYHYINSNVSIPYMVISGILIYPPLNLFYLLFLPEGGYGRILPYVTVWIVVMLIYEAVSIATGTVVFTGWRPIPWSIVTYITAYAWMTLLFLYLEKRLLPHSCKKKSA
jgi:hypothetical protein